MSERNDQKFTDDLGIAFAMYCDTNGLKMAEVEELSDELQHELDSAIDSIRMGRPESDKDAWPDA